jgi:hypothetical protein
MQEGFFRRDQEIRAPDGYDQRMKAAQFSQQAVVGHKMAVEQIGLEILNDTLKRK